MSLKDNNSGSNSVDFDLGSCRSNRPLVFSEVRKPTHPKYTTFLKGPISWNWIKAATRAGRNALFVGLNLCRYRDLRRKGEVQISLQKLGDGVLSRQAVRRILRQLEAVGLIRIKRVPGHLLAVTLLDVLDDAENAAQGRE
jgi:hypothetical protein